MYSEKTTTRKKIIITIAKHFFLVVGLLSFSQTSFSQGATNQYMKFGTGSARIGVSYYPSYGTGDFIISNGTQKVVIGDQNSGIDFGGATIPGSNSFVNFNFNGSSRFYGNGTFMGILSIGGSMATPTGYNLYVANGILTEKLKIALQNTTNWADFVFNKDYHLLSLKDVESYITKNKHLPEIPSADQMVKDGLDVATIESKLLQKIEELTLYVIEINKKVEVLSAENPKLKKR